MTTRCNTPLTLLLAGTVLLLVGLTGCNRQEEYKPPRTLTPEEQSKVDAFKNRPLRGGKDR